MANKKTHPKGTKKKYDKVPRINARDGSIIVLGDVDGSSLAALSNDKTRKAQSVHQTAQGDLPLGSYLPFSPNPLFTGRVADLEKLADALIKNAKTGTVITQAVIGMGGLGKTQLAVEFAYRYGDQFRGVHWLNLADPTTLDSEIALCGQKMGLDNWPEDQPVQVAMTELAWKSQGPRLLILDNFEDVSQANNVLPRLRHSNIRLLVTSRHSDWPATTGLSSIPLELFSTEESLAFLKESMKKRKDKDDELDTLSERLDYLPLALELASRYLNGHPRLNVSVYLEQVKEALEHDSMKGWRTDLPAPTQHDLDLQRTFAHSWQALKDETAQKMFQMAGYLAPNTPIPLEIFEKALEISGEQCDETLSLLYGLGLLHKSENELPAIHPLLAEFARVNTNDNKLLAPLGSSMAVICTRINEYRIPNELVPFRVHLENLARTAEARELPVAGSLWNNIGFHYREIAAFPSAKDAHEHGIALKQRVYGEDAEQLASDYNNLASVMHEQGDLDGAHAAHERAIKIWEANLGAEHPKVATGVNNLGTVMHEQGDLDGARAAFERAIKILEANLGTEHPEVAAAVNNLGSVMRAQGDLVGARAAFERAIKILEANLGTEHPNVASGLNNLALVMKAQGDFIGARAAYERALKIDEASFGPDHPSVAIRVNNLGMVMKAQGDLVGARAAFERALAIFKKILPPDHPKIKAAQGNLDSLEN